MGMETWMSGNSRRRQSRTVKCSQGEKVKLLMKGGVRLKGVEFGRFRISRDNKCVRLV